MKKRLWIIAVVIPLSLTWLFDRVTKIWALDLQGIQFFGPVGFTLHYNPGAILGLFSDLPAVLRIVSLSTGGAFLIFTFLIIQILLPVRSLMLRSGMSILLGGILGNVSDRIYWGYVVDFIVFTNKSFASPVFNIADALQWVGYFMVVVALIKEGKNIWPENNLRKSYWVDYKYQIQYCLKLIAFGIAFAIISGIYSYTFLKVALEESSSTTATHSEKILVPFVITYIIVSVVFTIILFFTGLVLSHRAAGPIYAFKRFMEDLMKGKYSPLKLRTGDEFKHLEVIAEDMAKKILPHIKQETSEETSPKADSETK